MNPLIPFKRMKLSESIVALALICFGVAPRVYAVVPPPDGGYQNANTAAGDDALLHLTTGGFNTAIGWFSLWSNASGVSNTGIGAGTLFANSGNQNTAIGAGALLTNRRAENNTADGAFALFNNTEGDANTATGAGALFSNTTAGENTATGAYSLFNNTIGLHNSAFGAFALMSNTLADYNSAFGWGALASNNNSANTAVGVEALLANTDGNSNTAVGVRTLWMNTTGSINTAIGFGALQHNTTGRLNTAVGDAALGSTSGILNTALGASAGSLVTTANNVICIGANVHGLNASNSCFIGSIYHINEGGPDILPIYINSNGQLGTQPPPSSRRFKKDITPMQASSEAILGLKPVAFRYQSDTNGTPQFGLIAEEVAAIHPDLVVRDENGEIYSVRYDAVNAMLLNEFLKVHGRVQDQACRVQEQEATIAQLKREIETLIAHVRRQDAKIQEVSDLVEMNGAAPQLVASDP